MDHVRFRRQASAISWVCVILCATMGCATFDANRLRQSANERSSPRSPNSPQKSSLPQNRSRESADLSTGVAEAVTPASFQSEPDSDLPQLLPGPPTENQASDSRFELSVTQCMTTALSHNLHLRVIENVSQETGKNSDIELAKFDTSLTTNAQYLQGVQQVASALQAVQSGLTQYGLTSFGPVAGSPNLLSIEKRYSSGTVARVGVGNSYNFTSPIGQYLIYNPAFQSAASVVLEQPLFKGASQEANLAGFHIAQINQQQSVAEFQAEVNKILADVQRAYWTAWLAESQVNVDQQFVDQSEMVHNLEQTKLRLGEGNVIQVAQASEHLQSMKAELAQARQRSKIARNKLYTLLGFSPTDRRDLKLTDAPVGEHVIPDLSQGLLISTQQRPEVQVRQHQVAQAQLELDRRKNNENSDVRLYAGYSLTGLNSNFGGAFEKLGTGEYGMGSIGIRYTRILGQRAEKAAVDQAQLALVRQIRAREETEFLIQQQVRDAVDAVQSSWDILVCQRERVQAARVQADTFTELHAAGKIDLDRLLRARQQLATGLQQANTAIIEYNLALGNWRYSIGALTSPVSAEARIDEPGSTNESHGIRTETNPIRDDLPSSLNK